jgi:hypothetical protein
MHCLEVRFLRFNKKTFYLQSGQVDGSTTATPTPDLVPKRFQLHEEEVLCQAFPEPKAAGMYELGPNYCQWLNRFYNIILQKDQNLR